MISAVETAKAVYRAYGVRGALLRARHEFRKRRGTYLDQPTSATAPAGAPFLKLDLDRLGNTISPTAIVRAERVAGGEYQAFGHEWRKLPSGDAWQVHPISGARYPDVPWYRIHHVDARVGDIKDTWEPARFGWVYDLVRGYAATRDRRFADAFWMRVDDFFACNPAFRGVQWSCGQETSMRTVALLWGEAAFAADATDAQRQRLANALYVSGERIADAINYGLSQRNNHGLWESTGVAAVGARFSASSNVAAKWVRSGLSSFEWCVLDQFETDGWYAQHSLTYARVALQSAVVMKAVARAADVELAADVSERLAATTQLLATLHDERSGDVPNYGANDGANPTPYSSADYRDFRPIIGAAAIALDLSLPDPFLPDREVEAWFGAEVQKSGTRAPLVVGESGWVSARHGSMHLFARAGTYRARPGHLDPGHIELWIDGRPVAVDAGTFRYSAPAPWNDGLRVTAVHNTIDVPALPIARRGPGFMSIGAPVAEVLSAKSAAGRIQIVLQNRSWADNGILHTRTIVLDDAGCRVNDIVIARRGTEVSLHWLTPSATDQPSVKAEAPSESRQVIGDANSVAGWRSLYYGEKTPACSTTTRVVVPEAKVVKLKSTFPSRG